MKDIYEILMKGNHLKMKDFFCKYKKDIQLIGAILGIQFIFLLIFLLFFSSDEVLCVNVTYDGEIIRTYDYYGYVTDKIELDGYYNTIEVFQGIVRVTESNCDNQICVNHEPINAKGESIICLPHKLVVQIDEKVKK